MKESTGHSLVLYDGTCAFCDGTVQFLLQHDSRGALLYAPLQGSTAASVDSRHGILRNGLRSVILVEHFEEPEEKVWIKSEAALRTASKLGGAWRLATLFLLIPTFLRDGVYDFIAANRYRWFGQHSICVLPPPQVRQRFLA